jgi:hypothetical protein
MTMILDCGFAQRADVGLAAASLPRTARTLQDGRFHGPTRCRVHCIGTGCSI